MNGYQCWFCGKGVEETDIGAVAISVQNLWRWHDGATGDDDPLQMVYAHSACTRERMQGATMSLDPSTFLEPE